MCDYSLHNIASRPAKVGDKLVSTRFKNTVTRGFAAVGKPNVAVCLLPGTEVAFDREIELDHTLDRLIPRLRFGKLGERLARFRQIDVDKPHVHHDALELANGEIVLLTRLREGQHATVLQLPAHSRNTTDAEPDGSRASLEAEVA